jgi:hypothetical protein
MNKLFKKVIFFAIFCNVITLYAQKPETDSYDWEEKRPRFKVSAEDQKESCVIFKNHTSEEIAYNEKNEPYIYFVNHLIVAVNNESGIEQYNKLSISLSSVMEIVDIKVRSISKDGKIVLTDKNHMKEIENLENKGAFKVFAVEGVEVGSEIEYIYKLKKYPANSGRRYIQFQNPTYNYSFDLIVPEFLTYDTKLYNGDAQIRDTVIDQKRYISLKIDKINALPKEEYSDYWANVMRVEYKVANNSSTGRTKIVTFAEAAKSIYANTHVTDAKIDKQVDALLKKIKLDKSAPEEDRIRVIENYVKSNYFINQNGSSESSKIDFILKNKFGSKFGMTKLFIKFFERAEVSHRLALSTNRTNERFDPKFETWEYLDEQLIYFDKLDKYMSPIEFEFRYPMIPSYFLGNHAMVIKPVKLGDYTTGLSEIRLIPSVDYKLNHDNLNIHLTIDLENDLSKVEVERSLKGYKAMFIQPYYDLIPEDKRKIIFDEILKSQAKDAEVSNVTVKNVDKNTSPYALPMIISGTLKSEGLIEKAGGKYLLKIGEIIGPQSELYQDKKRNTEISLEYPKEYVRKITFEIPQGYKIPNLKDLNKNIVFKDGDETTMGFTSSYKQDGRVVTIDVEEYYKRLTYPIGVFEQFRKVINAAADFNKITLVLEKE